MPRAREIRIALLGALVFIVAGSVQGCASDAMAPEDPVTEAQLDNETKCVLINGQWICQ